MLINISYFDTPDRNIPNTSWEEISSLVGDLISVYEREYLIRILGYELFKSLIEAMPLGINIPDRFLKILIGSEFTGFDGRLKKWRGLVSGTSAKHTIDFFGLDLSQLAGYEEVQLLESPIADYVYYFYVRNSVTQTASMGEVKTQNQNSVPVSPKFKMTSAWNSMVEKDALLYEFLYANNSDYPEWILGGEEMTELMTKINPYF